jgi:selenide, water dikinase
LITHPNLLAGMEHGEDAGVYKLSPEMALIQTVDFFTPIVDDPYTFGQIAVANALSDVYAMGGVPLVAMNIVCFPIHTLDVAILREILRGGLDKMREAGVLLIGGHSVEDAETKYGLSVAGTVHPEKVIRNRGLRPGDKLILTKPLGTGIVSTALKAGLAEEELVARAIASMSTLNKTAAELMTAAPGVHACTDITGFGLVGHACEMLEESGCGMVIDTSAVPMFAGIEEYVKDGILPAGLHRNRKYRQPMVEIGAACPDWVADVLFDPQTSGGLLIAVTAAEAGKLVESMRAAGVADAAVVGDVTQEPANTIRLQ